MTRASPCFAPVPDQARRRACARGSCSVPVHGSPRPWEPATAAPARVSAANAATGTKRMTLLMPPLPDGRLRPPSRRNERSGEYRSRRFAATARFGILPGAMRALMLIGACVAGVALVLGFTLFDGAAAKAAKPTLRVVGVGARSRFGATTSAPARTCASRTGSDRCARRRTTTATSSSRSPGAIAATRRVCSRKERPGATPWSSSCRLRCACLRARAEPPPR